MPRFRYRGRDKTGKIVEGMIDAANETAVALQLIQSGTNPITISQYVEAESAMQAIHKILNLDKPNLEDLGYLSRQMYSLTRAGIPLVRSVKVVLDSSNNPQLKLALMDVIASIEGGQSLANAMRTHPLVFPTLMISLVSVGENTGSLDKVFKQLSDYFEREIETKRRISMAMRYPLTVLCVIAIAIVILNIFVIPAFAQFFGQFHAQLPLPTRIIIGFSNFMVNDWPYLLIGLVVLFFSMRSYFRTAQGHLWWDKWKLTIPFIGSILSRSMLGRFARTFALCLRTGVPLLDSIGLIAKSTDNVYIGDKIMGMTTSIEHGESLTHAAIASGLFTPLVIQMLSVGEETGDIDRLLDEVANAYEEEVDYDIKRLGDAIEPILIFIIAGMVLVLALGIFLPLWDLWRVVLGTPS